MSSAPPIPVHLTHRPTVGGLVVPWITPKTHDGRHLFGKVAIAFQERCLRERRCQVCGQRLTDRTVLFARNSDLARMCTSEPATCPACASYTAAGACPMIAGRLDHYRSSEHPALAGRTAPATEALRFGAPAERWHTVWVRSYRVIAHPAQPDTLAASWLWPPPLRIRPVPTSP